MKAKLTALYAAVFELVVEVEDQQELAYEDQYDDIVDILDRVQAFSVATIKGKNVATIIEENNLPFTDPNHHDLTDAFQDLILS